MDSRTLLEVVAARVAELERMGDVNDAATHIDTCARLVLPLDSVKITMACELAMWLRAGRQLGASRSLARYGSLAVARRLRMFLAAMAR